MPYFIDEIESPLPAAGGIVWSYLLRWPLFRPSVIPYTNDRQWSADDAVARDAEPQELDRRAVTLVYTVIAAWRQTPILRLEQMNLLWLWLLHDGELGVAWRL
ncbi:hypothetical protein PGT21_021082 [Puccinia graminis f. sp. tritici]|uniref:Uncharacterized protein n=1 Tax=Puccinia graminis f. sp. tritici TaxID=56615 RepID=A0A5B0QVA6_PUCGR|nr:hypothetical protein PGT21_021082 [Puccinia graminis f. sp. tritici]KAA1117221.1 hypothetical protein PGTUg99_037106 [Puccinia graminis f. sp. tritici]